MPLLPSLSLPPVYVKLVGGQKDLAFMQVRVLQPSLSHDGKGGANLVG